MQDVYPILMELVDNIVDDGNDYDSSDVQNDYICRK